MTSASVAELTRIVKSLQLERQQHVDALAAIDAAFAQLGAAPPPVRRRGRPPAAAKAEGAAAPTTGKRRRRRKAKDGMTGEQFLLATLGSEKLSTAEINKKWADSGRKGSANNMLGLLVKNGQLKRQDNKEGRGSTYSAA